MAIAVENPSDTHKILGNDGFSLNESVYSADAPKRFSMGNFIVQSNKSTKSAEIQASSPDVLEEATTTAIGKSLHNNPKRKTIKEFPVRRKGSVRGVRYFKVPTDVPSNTKSQRRISKFDKPEDLDTIFSHKSRQSLLENPAYMIQYFTKNLELLKHNPKLEHKVVKAELEINAFEATPAPNKERKYHSLPVMSKSKSPINVKEMQRNQRQSAPVRLVYKPTDLTLAEYLNTPLDFYSHKKKNSKTSIDEIKLRQTSNESVATSTASLRRARFTDSQLGGRKLTTKRTDNILKKAEPKNVKSNSVSSDLDDPAKRKRSLQRESMYLSKIGAPLRDTGAGVKVEVSGIKRKSDSGNLSIATGNDLYNEIKSDIFGRRFKSWRHVERYLEKKYPHLVDNTYFMTRFMHEIYMRRVVAARIALKLGSDKANRGAESEVWVGLKESIAAVYGEDNASFFEGKNHS